MPGLGEGEDRPGLTPGEIDILEEAFNDPVVNLSEAKKQEVAEKVARGSLTAAEAAAKVKDGNFEFEGGGGGRIPPSSVVGLANEDNNPEIRETNRLAVNAIADKLPAEMRNQFDEHRFNIDNDALLRRYTQNLQMPQSIMYATQLLDEITTAMRLESGYSKPFLFIPYRALHQTLLNRVDALEDQVLNFPSPYLRNKILNAAFNLTDAKDIGDMTSTILKLMSKKYSNIVELGLAVDLIKAGATHLEVQALYGYQDRIKQAVGHSEDPIKVLQELRTLHQNILENIGPEYFEIYKQHDLLNLPLEMLQAGASYNEVKVMFLPSNRLYERYLRVDNYEEGDPEAIKSSLSDPFMRRELLKQIINDHRDSTPEP